MLIQLPLLQLFQKIWLSFIHPRKYQVTTLATRVILLDKKLQNGYCNGRVNAGVQPGQGGLKPVRGAAREYLWSKQRRGLLQEDCMQSSWPWWDPPATSCCGTWLPQASPIYHPPISLLVILSSFVGQGCTYTAATGPSCQDPSWQRWCRSCGDS